MHGVKKGEFNVNMNTRVYNVHGRPSIRYKILRGIPEERLRKVVQYVVCFMSCPLLLHEMI